MKKILSTILAVAIACTMFVGCTSKGMKDGTYKAEFDKADDHGWTDYVEITVSGEKITAVVFDSIDADGQKKKSSTDYDEAMKNAGSKTWPSEFMPKLEKELLDSQDITKVDSVAGATDSSNNFKKLVKELTKNMSKGDTTTLKVAR